MRRSRLLTTLATIVAGALTATISIGTSAQGCPSHKALANFKATNDGLAASSSQQISPDTYFLKVNDETAENQSLNGGITNWLTGIPGVIEYCVYTATAPDSVAAQYSNAAGTWTTVGYDGTKQFFGFKRPNGDPTNIPL